MAKTRETQERYEQQPLDLSDLSLRPRRLYTLDDVVQLHEALEPFIDLGDLRRYVAESRDVYQALRVDKPPRELRALMDTLAAVLRPVAREQIKSLSTPM